MCHLAQAMKGDANSLLKGVANTSTIEAVKHILEMVCALLVCRYSQSTIS